MGHVQERALERLGVSVSSRELKKLSKDITEGRCKRFLFLGKTIGVYQVFLNDGTEAVAIFDLHHMIIKTIGPKTWVKKIGSHYKYIPKKLKEEPEYKHQSQKKRKKPYARVRNKRKTQELLQRNEDFC